MDEKQFITLIEQHQGILHRICRLYAENHEDRKDLFQEMLYQLYKSLPGFENRSSFSSWMYRIALSTALAGFRKKRPPIVFREQLDDNRVDDDAGPSGQEEQLFQALQTLDDGQKALIALYLDDLSYRQISEIVGISENYVAVKINRIKTKLQQHLNQQTWNSTT